MITCGDLHGMLPRCHALATCTISVRYDGYGKPQPTHDTVLKGTVAAGPLGSLSRPATPHGLHIAVPYCMYCRYLRFEVPFVPQRWPAEVLGSKRRD